MIPIIGFLADTQAMADYLNVPEKPFKLLLMILVGYPFALIYRLVLRSSPYPFLHHSFIIYAGFFVVAFSYSIGVIHTIIAISVSCVLLRILRGLALVWTTIIFHMSYLLIGYVVTGTDTYDITWTMPHCVLVLRLIGLSFDVYDGQRPKAELSVENKKSCLPRVPGVLETFSYALFPASVLVGPQFSFRRYESYMAQEWDDRKGFISAGFRRGAYGMCYLAMNQIGQALIPDEYIRSAEFDQRFLISKLLIVAVWGKFTLYKYIACWLLSEGAATCFGLSYVGKKSEDDPNDPGGEDWSGLKNIRIGVFENASRFQHYIDSFNVNTNHWTAEYVYKRLKFLGNRNLSQAAALGFLAVWHGFHSGYYMSFFFEYVVMSFERAIQPIILRNDRIMSIVGLPVPSLCVWILLKVYTLFGIGYSLVPFVFLTFDKWWPIYRSLGFYGFWFFGPWPVYKIILQVLLSNKKQRATSTTTTTSNETKEKVN